MTTKTPLSSGEKLGIAFGIVSYLAYLISGFLDNNNNTPTEIIGGIRPWDWYYYPVVIIEYAVLYPIWHMFSRYIIGGLFEGFLRRND